MIESIDAVTLATHDMPRAVRFYRALGFEVVYGGEASPFTSLRAGGGHLNLAARPVQQRWPWWGRVARVAYVGWDGHVQEIRLDGEGWAQADLANIVRNPPAAPAAGGLAAFTTPDGVTRVVYVGWGRRIHEIRLDGEGWAHADLSAIVRNQPPAPPATGIPAAQVTSDGVARVFYRGRDDGHVHEIRLDNEGWAHADLSAIVRNGAPAPTASRDSPAACVTPDGVARVFYSRRDGGQVHEIRLEPDGWAHADLSAIVRNDPPAPAAAGGLAALVTRDGVARVFYRGRDDGRIREVRLDGEGWAQADLMPLVRNPPPPPPATGAVNAFATQDGVARVVYVS
jgi:YD repeat-containing protein